MDLLCFCSVLCLLCLCAMSLSYYSAEENNTQSKLAIMIICYKYNKPIRSTIFNFNKIVNDLDIDSNTPAS